MQSVTLFVAATASLLVLSLGPLYGLIIYIGALLLYPISLTVHLGPLTFPVSRIVIIALYANIFLNTNLTQKFKLVLPDKFMIAFFICQAVSGGVTNPNVISLLENRAGRFLDMALPYFAVRLIVTNRQQYILLLKSILCMIAILAIPAFYQSVTGYNFLDFGRNKTFAGKRHGLYRAFATFKHPIYLGVFFAMAGGMCTGLLKNVRKNILLYKIGIGLALLGVISTMSSGALLAALSAISFIAFYKYRKYWKQATIVIIFMCLAVEVVSNRHFFEVIDRFAFSGGTAWYRARLIEVVLFEGGMSGHWLLGYGMADPGWSHSIDGRSHTDMVNQYFLVLSRFGLVGFIPFCGLIMTSVYKLFESFWTLHQDRDSWLVWCLAGGLFGALISFNGVSVFGQPTNFFYMMLGLCSSLSTALHISETQRTTTLSGLLGDTNR